MGTLTRIASTGGDHSGSCAGYLKTYGGEGNEALLVLECSPHLDVLALDRGWKGAAASLDEPPSLGGV